MVLAAVKQNDRELQYASRQLRAQREVVPAAVMQDGGALPYTSAALRIDKNTEQTEENQQRRAEYAVWLTKSSNKDWETRDIREELKDAAENYGDFGDSWKEDRIPITCAQKEKRFKDWCFENKPTPKLTQKQIYSIRDEIDCAESYHDWKTVQKILDKYKYHPQKNEIYSLYYL